MIMAGISVFCTLFFMLVVKENNRAKDVVSTGSWKDFASLLSNKNIIIINIISFIALGFFNGLTGWIEPILGERNISKDDAGIVAGVVIFGGILGAAIIPMISGKTKRRRPFILLSAILATALAYPLMTGSDLGMLIALGGAIGFLFLPGYPLLMAASEEEAGKAKAGASTGLLMFSGNLGGIIAIMGMQFIKGDGPTWMPAIYFCVGLIALAIPFALLMKETYHRRAQ
jgi:sugar phosphate permease